jgi:hypothetical protein
LNARKLEIEKEQQAAAKAPVYTHTRTHTHTHTHTHSHARTHARTHARARAHTHTHTCNHAFCFSARRRRIMDQRFLMAQAARKLRRRVELPTPSFSYILAHNRRTLFSRYTRYTQYTHTHTHTQKGGEREKGEREKGVRRRPQIPESEGQRETLSASR